MDYRSPFPNPDRFDDFVRQKQAELAQFSQKPIVLLCEADPERFLAGFLAACRAEVAVFLANPQWQQREWQQVAELAQFNCIWGNAPIAPSSHFSDNPPQIMIPTGGTSGRIRFAVHRWETLEASAQGFQQYVGGGAIHCCCTLPVFHVSGLMQFVRSLVTGGQLVLHPYKSLEAGVLPDIECNRFWISLVPTQLQRLLDRESLIPALRRFQGILLGGAPAWPSLLETARSQELPLALTYGTTETASQVATLLPQDFLAGRTSSGRVLPHAEIEIRDGAIVVRGRSLMQGYYGEAAIDELNTDDLGYFDDDGFLHVLGRASHTIITGGEKVFPVEVEAALRSTQKVKDVCVVGIADEEWGEAVAAVYVPLPGCSAAVLKQALSAELAAYKHPKIWLETEALPRSDRGKIRRDSLQSWVKSALQK